LTNHDLQRTRIYQSSIAIGIGSILFLLLALAGFYRLLKEEGRPSWVVFVMALMIGFAAVATGAYYTYGEAREKQGFGRAVLVEGIVYTVLLILLWVLVTPTPTPPPLP